jgi:hypothetical protein
MLVARLSLAHLIINGVTPSKICSYYARYVKYARYLGTKKAAFRATL